MSEPSETSLYESALVEIHCHEMNGEACYIITFLISKDEIPHHCAIRSEAWSLAPKSKAEAMEHKYILDRIIKRVGEVIFYKLLPDHCPIRGGKGQYLAHSKHTTSLLQKSGLPLNESDIKNMEAIARG